MNEDYDVIVLGTGVKECIISALMSYIAKKKVLHLDRNPYYGGESSSLNLEQLFKRFRDGKKPPEKLGKSREYCVDLCPKFLMACGNLVKLLIKTSVTDYLEFRSVGASYYLYKGKPVLVPNNAKTFTTSKIVGIMDKGKVKKFLEFVGSYDPADPRTHKKGKDTLKIDEMTCADLYKAFDLPDNVKDFIGQAIGLYLNDEYLEEPAIELIQRGQLYANSVARYGHSPYIYPKYGLCGLPEGFSRRCAVHGGVYMLNSDEKKNFIEKIHYDEDGKVVGVQVDGQTAKCTQLIADPSYFVGTNKVKVTHKISRGIYILDHPIKDTNNVDSCQIIIPWKTLDTKKYKARKSNIFVCMTSYEHNIAAPGKYIAVCSALSEHKDPIDDLKPAIDLFGKYDEEFVWQTDYFESVNTSSEDNVFITKSYDATTHFESCSTEVMELYEKITGQALDLQTEKAETEEKKEDGKT